MAFRKDFVVQTEREKGCVQKNTLLKIIGVVVLLLVIAAVIAIIVVFTRDDSAEPELIIPKMRKVAEGLKFSEGPVFDKNGHFFMVAARSMDPLSGYVLNVNLNNGNVSIHCEPKLDGHSGFPLGLTLDNDNTLLVADVRLGILRVQPNGSYQLVANSDSKGRRLIGCNDLTFDYEGTLWFTTPGPPLAPVPFIPFSAKYVEEADGMVYGMTRDGRVIRIDSGLKYPNGIAVQHTAEGKPSKLLVANWIPLVIYSYDIVAPGIVRNKRVWGKLQDNPISPEGPDGMKFDEDGYLLVTHYNGQRIEVFGPDGGNPLVRIKVPFSKVTNLAFRPNSSEVYVTAGNDNYGLWAFNWRAKGQKLWSEL